MKYIWLWMLGIAYLIWTILSIIEIIKGICNWINSNMEEVTDDSHITPVTKKKWVYKRPFKYCLDYDIADFALAWIGVTIGIIFVISLGIHMASCAGVKLPNS